MLVLDTGIFVFIIMTKAFLAVQVDEPNNIAWIVVGPSQD